MKNNRTFLEKLLDGAEVEWKPLGDVCNFQNGFAFKSSLFKDNGSPIVRITNIDGKEVNLSDVKYFLLDDYNTDMTPYEVHQGDILIAMSGATTGKIGFYNYEHPSYLNQRVGKFSPNTNILNNRYLYHYLLSKVEDIYIISGGGAQPNLSSNRLMSEVLIPIPSLPIQTEIVKILDVLTALTSELTSELILRQKQYEYYREKLLSFDSLEQLNSGRGKKKLIDVAKIKNGKDWKHLEEGNIPIYGSGGIMGYVDTYSYDKPTVLIPRKGTITNIFYLEEPFWNVDTIYYTEIDTTQILPKYFYHFMKTVDLTKLDTGSGRPSLTQAILNEIPIFVPSIEEQQRIISILDKFETLTNSITEGLPLAIEQSQKRYEYYRELLLNFS